MVIDEVHRVAGRVRGEHPGGERALQCQRVRAVREGGQPGPQRLQLGDGGQPEGGAGVSVPARSTIAVELAASLAGESAGLSVTSDVDPLEHP